MLVGKRQMLCTWLCGHILHIEYDFATIASQDVDKFRRSDIAVILGGYGDAGAEKEVIFFQHLHRLHSTLEHAFASALVCTHGCAFNADDWHHVEVLTEKLHVGRADECAIGENRENHVLHLSDALQDVFPHQGFASSDEGEVDAHVGSLCEDALPLLPRQGVLALRLLILRNPVAPCIAALAMQVAGGGYTADKKRRHLQPLSLQYLLSPLLRLLKERLHPIGELRLPRVREHIPVGFRHDGVDAVTHVGTQVDCRVFCHSLRCYALLNNTRQFDFSRTVGT